MPSGDNLDLQIMLEIVRYMNHRDDSQAGSTSVTLTEVIQNLPPGVSIGTIIGAIVKPEEVVLGDNYNTGQAGAVGPHAKALNNTITQTWLAHGAEFDLDQLSLELKQLRAAARAAGTGDADEDLALGELASAEKAANAGDGPAVLRHLANAGRWVLEVASKIGVPIAVKAIQTALGMTT